MPELERDLRALGQALAFPSTPDLADGIGRRLPVRSSPPWKRRAVLLAAVVTAALLATLAIPQARSALARIFGIGAVRIEYVDRPLALNPTSRSLSASRSAPRMRPSVRSNPSCLVHPTVCTRRATS